MRVLRVVLGFLMAGALVSAVWVIGWLSPPEGLRRMVVAFVAVYPAPVSGAEIDRIECDPMSRRRFYVVCTEGCEKEWRLMGVVGLRVETLENLNRVPRDDEEQVRRRLNDFIAREGMSLDMDGARAMIACHMRLAGLYPELVLDTADLNALIAIREDEDAMRRLAENLDRPALEAMKIRETGNGFAADFLYWDTARVGRPVLEVTYQITRNGQLLAVEAAGPVLPEESAPEAWH